MCCQKTFGDYRKSLRGGKITLQSMRGREDGSLQSVRGNESRGDRVQSLCGFQDRSHAM